MHFRLGEVAATRTGNQKINDLGAVHEGSFGQQRPAPETPSVLVDGPEQSGAFVRGALIALLAVEVSVAAMYWSQDGRMSGGYDISFGPALVVASLPALPIRWASTMASRRWLNHQVRHGPRSGLACFVHLAIADTLVAALLGAPVFPVLVLSYFVMLVNAYSLLLPPMTLATAAWTAAWIARPLGGSNADHGTLSVPDGPFH